MTRCQTCRSEFDGSGENCDYCAVSIAEGPGLQARIELMLSRKFNVLEKRLKDGRRGH